MTRFQGVLYPDKMTSCLCTSAVTLYISVCLCVSVCARVHMLYPVEHVHFLKLANLFIVVWLKFYRKTDRHEWPIQFQDFVHDLVSECIS